MLLCDIGNSNVHFLQNGRQWSISLEEFKSFVPEETLFYINVNEALKIFLKDRKNFINLEPYFNFDTIYQGIGIDRVAACYTISDGIVIDAGSAITVDIMTNGLHLGGYILPGLSASLDTYSKISPALKTYFNPSVILDALPQKTADAVNYGILKSILLMLQNTCLEKNIYFTGGDGKFFSKFFKHSIHDKMLVFRGMQKAIEENDLSKRM